MKPVRLVVQAFGPYAGRQEFDFGALGDRHLFLIAGPTGAGKSTVLDAVCCALYGTTSGDERTPDQMRSQHAAADVAPEVSFEFRLGEKAYRVRRTLEHQRPAKRGGGTVRVPKEASLWDVTGLPDPAQEGTPLAGQWEKVTQKVTELLGFRDDEFRQVVLIPQGRFRDLLVADSKQREKILETLFRTHRYGRIERALKDAFASVERRLVELRQNQEGVLKVEGVDSVEALEQRARDIEAEGAQAAAEAEAARAAAGAAEGALAEGRRVAALLAEREAAGAVLGALEGRAGEMEAARAEAEAGRAAAGLEDVAAEAGRRAAEAGRLRAEADGAAAALARSRADLATAEAGLEAARATEPEQADLQRTALELEGLAGRVAALGEARTALEAAGGAEAQARARLEEARRSAEVLAAEGADAKAALEALARGAATLEAAGMALRLAREARRKGGDLEAARAEAAAAREVASAAAAGLAEARGRHDRARAALEAAEAALRDGAAGLLAATLAEGVPCPVCGSASHPDPARAAADLPDPARVEALRAEVAALAGRAQAAGDGDRAAQARLADAAARVEVLARELAGQADVPLSDLDRAQEQARLRLEEAANAENRLREETRAQAEREARLAAATAEAEARQQAAHEAKVRQEAAQARLAEREAAVPGAWRDPAALEEARRTAARRLEALREAQQRAGEAHQEAARRVASGEAGAKAAAGAAEAAEAVAAAGAEAFGERLRAAGFPDVAAFQAARRTPAALAALEARLQDWAQALAAGRDRRDRAEAAAAGLAAPDLPALQASAAAAGQALALALQRSARLAQQAEQKRGTLQALGRDAARRADLEREFGVLGRLAEVANGRNELNLPFQRYVLGALLDEVLVAATARLRQMCAGRYLLQRAGTVADRRRASGLDLEVMDTYTGQARPVATLSGGESFLAALSLALGLADVVQSFSGGIRLETVFIDEGFGSLDPEALDLALRELVRLREGGRLVGIISHVPELRQRIDARLEVTADRNGSHARFVVG